MDRGKQSFWGLRLELAYHHFYCILLTKQVTDRANQNLREGKIDSSSWGEELQSHVVKDTEWQKDCSSFCNIPYYTILTISKSCYNYCFPRKYNKIIIIPSKKDGCGLTKTFLLPWRFTWTFWPHSSHLPLHILKYPIPGSFSNLFQQAAPNVTLANLPASISAQLSLVASRPVDLSLEWLPMLHPPYDHY